MRRTVNILCILFCLFLISSCLEEDDRITLPPPGDEEVVTVSQGPDYYNQIYFDLLTQNTGQSDFRSWDLAFESTETGVLIWMNSGKLMQVYNTKESNINAVSNTQLSSAVWEFDDPSWAPDSNAIGAWFDSTGTSKNDIYIIDRGVFNTGPDQHWKLQVVRVDNAAYQIKIERLDGTNFNGIEIPKDPTHNYVYFSFDNGGSIVDLAPPKDSWDLLFTRYGYVYYDFVPPLQYLVTGVLLNPNKVLAYKDSLLNFNDIDVLTAQQLDLSNDRDAIGFDWKYYDFGQQRFVINPKYNYIIKDTDGYYFKLKFIDFYDPSGEKGHPKFIYQRL